MIFSKFQARTGLGDAGDPDAARTYVRDRLVPRVQMAFRDEHTDPETKAPEFAGLQRI
jgi:hypothetical protein